MIYKFTSLSPFVDHTKKQVLYDRILENYGSEKAHSLLHDNPVYVEKK